MGTILGPDYAYDLAPGEILTITASAVVTQSVTNTAVWLATDNAMYTAVATDAATVNVFSANVQLYLPVVLKP